MSNLLWNTLEIKVPATMLELTKMGRVTIKNTLTKTKNISRSQKTPAIKLVPSKLNHIEIVNKGKEWNIDELRQTMKKSNELAKKNKGRSLKKSNKELLKDNKFIKDIKQTVIDSKERKKIYKIKAITDKYLNPLMFTTSRDFKITTFETEDGYIFYFNNKKDYETAKHVITESTYHNKKNVLEWLYYPELH